MKKKYILPLSLIPIVLLGSFITFYATNFVLSDVCNLTYGITNRPIYVFASLPALNLSFIFVLATIFIIRYIRNPQHLKSLSRLYVIIFMAFSFIGLISAIFSGICVYNTFTAPNPFPGYLILSIVLFTIFLILGALFFLLLFKKIPFDVDKRKIKGGYVFYSIVLSVLTFYAYNRFGALIWLGTYVDLPTLYMTWPYYLALLLPVAMLVHSFLYSYDIYKKHSKGALIVITVILTLFVMGTIYTGIIGIKSPEFISVISPAAGASRLLAKPIDFFMHTILFGALGIYTLVHSIKYYLKHKDQ